MGQALEVLYALWRLDEISGMQGAQILQTTLCAAIDRTLWLCESNGRPDEKEFHAHLHSWQALCHILRDLHSGVNLPGVSLSAAVALLERRSQAIHAPALDRGATLGALMRLEHPNASAEAALTMLAQLSPAQSGEALHGLLALARHQLACQPVFIAGFSSHLNQLSDADFINALPDLRAAMAWLPPRERGTLAHQVLEHYQLAQLPVSALQMPLHCPPQAIAHHQQLEQQALASLQYWGVSMSELNDLLTTRELQRWRLILGEAAETTLCGLDDNARQIDHALEWLYGRDPERLQRGERSGGLGGSNLTTPEWINSIHTLFPQRVIERLESDAVLRYGIEDVVTNLDVLERMQPSESLLRAVLHTKHLMNPEVLAAARRIVHQVVEEIMARLAKEVRQAFSGVRDRRRRSFIPLARNFDFKSTLRANLQHWHPQHGKLYIESPRFNSRIKRHSEQWQLVLLVDQSGSMVDSVIHSAVMAACLWQLPGIRTHLVAFDTSVVDLTADVVDPVELLMKVQLGGGTNIASAVEYGRQLIEQLAKSVIILVSDFYEGGSSSLLTHQVKKCVQSGIKVLGLAALDSTATPCYDRDMAQALVNVGAQIAAMTPGELASWLAENLQS